MERDDKARARKFALNQSRFRDANERHIAGAILAVTADLSLLEELRFSIEAVTAGVAALRAGAT